MLCTVYPQTFLKSVLSTLLQDDATCTHLLASQSLITITIWSLHILQLSCKGIQYIGKQFPLFLFPAPKAHKVAHPNYASSVLAAALQYWMFLGSSSINRNVTTHSLETCLMSSS